ncbi:hypothetical protein KFE98_11200 [bacterium SCSIO 12741]|nr:hypothetical protein KFE98_11200 [bacterium SCSIO 12741]
MKAFYLIVLSLIIGFGTVQGQNRTDYFSNGNARHEVKELPRQMVQVTSFYRNGEVKEVGQYYRGKRHGIWQNFHRNGATNTKAFYNNDRRDGMWKFYDNEGNLKAVIYYRKNNVIRYYEDELAIRYP